MSDTTLNQLITDHDSENVKRLNAYQDTFGLAWLNVVSSQNLGQKLTYQQQRISISPPGSESLPETHLP